MAEPSWHEVKLIEKNALTRDIVALTFERPAGFAFKAGQFVQFEVPDGEKPVARSFSISSLSDAPFLEFGAKLIAGGKASEFFRALAIGDTARISPAKGVFVCKPEHHPRKVFVATGTGLCPIVSMIGSRLGSGDQSELIFGVRSEADLFWLDRLERFKQKDRNFHFTVTLTRPVGSWPGQTGRVTSHLIDRMNKLNQPASPPRESSSANYYLCGSLPMVKDARTILVSNGVPMKEIHFEIF